MTLLSFTWLHRYPITCSECVNCIVFLIVLLFLLQEIDELTVKNRDLKAKLEQLTSTKDELYEVIKFHFSKCHGKPTPTTIDD